MIIIVSFLLYHMELAYNNPPVCKKFYMLVSSPLRLLNFCHLCWKVKSHYKLDFSLSYLNIMQNETTLVCLCKIVIYRTPTKNGSLKFAAVVLLMVKQFRKYIHSEVANWQRW